MKAVAIGAALVAWILAGGGAAPTQAQPTTGRLVAYRDALQQVELNDELRYAVAGDSLRFPVRLAPGAVLRTALGVRGKMGKGAGGNPVEFTVTLLRQGGRDLLFRGRASGGVHAKWTDLRVPLWPQAVGFDVAGESELVGELLLEAKGVREAVPPDSVVWEAPRIEPVRRGDGPNVLLLSIDTLRADHLGCYGYGRDTSPNIDRLASEGVLFERAISTSSWTLPAQASLFSGLVPSRHGATRPAAEYGLAPRLDTLAERLWDAGYVTAAFTGDMYLSVKRGFAQGFDRFRSELDVERPTELFGRKVEWALDWMEEMRDQRFFLFLHTYAAHIPYEPAPAYAQRFDPDYEGPFKSVFTRLDLDKAHDGHDFSAAQVRHVEALYDGGIAELDVVVGRLLAGLRRRGLDSNTCLVLTSDHGEEFREHGELLHHHATLFDELLHIPLIIRCPRQTGAPHRTDALVSLVDVMPTILSLAGVAIPDGLDGVDLSPLYRGADDALRGAVLSQVDAAVHSKQGSSASLRSQRYKLIETQPGAKRQLFDLRVDPGEHEDVSGARPRVVKRMLEELHARERVGRLERGEPNAAKPRPLETPDAATLERLRNLGYFK